MKFLILAHQDDATAMRVYQKLVDKNHIKDVSIVSDEELIFAKKWQHDVSSEHQQTIITLNNGLILDSEKITTVFNRLRGVSMPHFELSKKADQQYAQMEMYALFLSWLYSIPNAVFNAAKPNGLGSRDYSFYKWLALGEQAGLPVRKYCFTSNSRRYYQKDYPSWKLNSNRRLQLNTNNVLMSCHLSRQPVIFLEPEPIRMNRVLVIGNRIVGDLDKQFHQACFDLSRKVACALLQLDFGLFKHSWKLMAVDAFPHISNNSGIDAIVSFIENNSLTEPLS